MSRISYTEDEEYGGEFELQQANRERSMRGKKGQAELRILRDALLALPDKRLIADDLETDGEMCAIACYGKFKGLDLSKFDPEESDEVGKAGGMPPMVAWNIVWMNDEYFDSETPEERYVKMLAWVESKLRTI